MLAHRRATSLNGVSHYNTPSMVSHGMAVDILAIKMNMPTFPKVKFEFEDDQPRWTQVADIMRSRIADGTYAPGKRVPSVLQLQEEFGIATATAQKVHRALRSEGLIHTQSGMGSYVKRQGA